MEITKFEIKRNYKVTLIWSIAVSLVATLYIAMSPLFVDQADTIMDFMASIGEDLVASLGINFDNFFTPVGFFSYIGGYIFAAMGVQAIIYGIKAFVKEKNQKSTEFLYTKPVSRTSIYIQKTVANAILLLITQVIVISVIMGTTALFNDVDYNQTLLLKEAIAIIPIQFLFLGLGTLIGCSVDRLKNIVSVSIGLSIGMFVLNMLASILESDILGYISFFNYFNLSEIVTSEQFDNQFVGLTIILLFIFYIGGLFIFNHRDIKSA